MNVPSSVHLSFLILSPTLPALFDNIDVLRSPPQNLSEPLWPKTGPLTVIPSILILTSYQSLHFTFLVTCFNFNF